MITHFKIYGERCSGTNYLENVILKNFKATLSEKYEYKHFFGFEDQELVNSDNTLFICIVRHPIKWINSFYRNMYHLPLKYMNIDKNEKRYKFLNDEFWSFYDDSGKNLNTSKEIMADRNIYTHNRYKNIFELRFTKLKYLIEDLPKKVKNYIFIRYEDLYSNFNFVMNQIKNKGLIVKNTLKFPVNILKYKQNNKKFFVPNEKVDDIPSHLIKQNKNWIKYNYYEKLLGYNN
jgi:hypothetical protein